MAGFPGMPLGSFSGRGADLQPMQFIMEQRRLAAQAEAQRKAQKEAAAQSFTMALLAKKQQEQELAQRASEAQMQHALAQQQQQRIAEQFQAEQKRLMDQERARLGLDERRLSLAQDAEQRRLQGQSEDDARMRAGMAQREQDQRNTLGVAGHVGTMGDEAYSKFLTQPVAQAKAEYDAALAEVQRLGAPSASGPASLAKAGIAASRAHARLAAAKQKLDEAQGMGPDYFAAVDKAAEALRFHAASIPDAGAKASYLKAIELWRKSKRGEAATDRAIADDRAERADKRQLQSEKIRLEKAKAHNAPLEKRIIKLQSDLKDYEMAAKLVGEGEEQKRALDEAENIRKQIAELEKQLMPVE